MPWFLTASLAHQPWGRNSCSILSARLLCVFMHPTAWSVKVYSSVFCTWCTIMWIAKKKHTQELKLLSGPQHVTWYFSMDTWGRAMQLFDQEFIDKKVRIVAAALSLLTAERQNWGPHMAFENLDRLIQNRFYIYVCAHNKNLANTLKQSRCQQPAAKKQKQKHLNKMKTIKCHFWSGSNARKFCNSLLRIWNPSVSQISVYKAALKMIV